MCNNLIYAFSFKSSAGMLESKSIEAVINKAHDFMKAAIFQHLST